MKIKFVLFTLIVVIMSGCYSKEKVAVNPSQATPWIGVHLLGYETNGDIEELGKLLPELVKIGVNVIVLEIDYNFKFKSHPELRWGKDPITKDTARKFSRLCKNNGLQLIPEFQCLAHQSWEGTTYPLLTKYPQFDLTPGAFPGNKGIYCREWDLMNPEVNRIIFQLLDEIIDAFAAKSFHVGMDEVFLLGSQQSPSTKGMDPGKLFAKAVNDIYNHLVKNRGVQMLMWSDRLFDGKNYSFGEWESSLNGTASALDKIPRDIILCPWHYEVRKSYPSIDIFIKEGFRVLPTSWKDIEAAKALIGFSRSQNKTAMLGHLFSTWSKVDILKWPPLLECIQLLQNLN